MSEESVDSLLAWRTISRLDWGERELGTPTSSDLLNPIRLASAKLYTQGRDSCSKGSQSVYNSTYDR